MNIPLIIVLCVICVNRIEALTNEDGDQRLSRQIDTCDLYPSMKCSSDCSSLLICPYENSPPVSLKCPIDKPYCLNGKCGTVNGNCRTTSNGFTCTSNGTFPDPTDCTKFYACNGENSVQYTCTSGFIFNSKFNRCERGMPRVDHGSRKICQKITCDKKPNGFILFPANPAFYANCSNDGGVQTMTMYKCDDVNNYVFDLSLQRCIFNCKSPGYFADPLNCTSYYVCEGWIKFKFTRMDCSEGHYFNGTSCVSGMNCGSPTDPPTTANPHIPPVYPNGTSTANPHIPPVYPNGTTTASPHIPPVNPTGTTTASPHIPPVGADPLSSSVFLLDHLFTHVKKTTKSPLPYSSLWKHKGKYSIRVA